MKTEVGEERTPGKLQNDIVANNKFFFNQGAGSPLEKSVSKWSGRAEKDKDGEGEGFP